MPTDFEICTKRPNCDNNGFIIIDANFIFYLIDAICGAIEEDYDGGRRDDKYAKFCEMLDSILRSVKCCSLDETLWTSNKVYSKEIDPTFNLSSLRKKVPIFETMCSRENRKYREVDRILRNHLKEVGTSNGEISLVRGLYSHGPADRDASLIVSSIKKSHAGFRTLLLTDDENLIGRLETIIRRGNITFGSTSYSTSQIYDRGFLSFLELVHDCCNLSQDHYRYCLGYRFLSELARADYLSRPLRETKKKKLTRALGRWAKAVQDKARQPCYAT